MLFACCHPVFADKDKLMALARVLVGIIQIGALRWSVCTPNHTIWGWVQPAVHSPVNHVGFRSAPSKPTMCATRSALPFPRPQRQPRPACSLLRLPKLPCLFAAVHYPVNHFPARNASRDLLVQLTGRSFEGWRFNTAEVFAFYAATLALSMVSLRCWACCHSRSSSLCCQLCWCGHTFSAPHEKPCDGCLFQQAPLPGVVWHSSAGPPR